MAIEANLRLAGVPTGMMQLDIILPSQHFRPRRTQAPEHRLMIAVLRDALDCLEKYRFATGRHGRRLFHEAKQWFLADETEWPYSFECICGFLDLDANAVRQRLRVAPEPESVPEPQRLEAAVVARSGVCSVQDDLRIADRPGTRHVFVEGSANRTRWRPTTPRTAEPRQDV